VFRGMVLIPPRKAPEFLQIRSAACRPAVHAAIGDDPEKLV